MPSNHLILLPPSPPAFNLSQHQSFPMSQSLHEVAKVLEFQLQHQLSFIGGQNKDDTLGDSTLDGSEKLLWRGTGGRSVQR